MSISPDARPASLARAAPYRRNVVRRQPHRCWWNSWGGHRVIARSQRGGRLNKPVDRNREQRPNHGPFRVRSAAHATWDATPLAEASGPPQR
jgi:hypothetical protein